MRKRTLSRPLQAIRCLDYSSKRHCLHCIMRRNRFCWRIVHTRTRRQCRAVPTLHHKMLHNLVEHSVSSTWRTQKLSTLTMAKANNEANKQMANCANKIKLKAMHCCPVPEYLPVNGCAGASLQIFVFYLHPAQTRNAPKSMLQMTLECLWHENQHLHSQALSAHGKYMKMAGNCQINTKHGLRSRGSATHCLVVEEN